MVPAISAKEWKDFIASEEAPAVDKAYGRVMVDRADFGNVQGSSFASYATNAADTGIHRRTAIDANQRWEARGALATRRVANKADRLAGDGPRRTNVHYFYVSAAFAARRKVAVQTIKVGPPPRMSRGIVAHVAEHRCFDVFGADPHSLCDRFFRCGAHHRKSIAQMKAAITDVARLQDALTIGGAPMDVPALIDRVLRFIRSARPIESDVKLSREELAPPRFDDGTPAPLRRPEYAGRPTFDPPPLKRT